MKCAEKKSYLTRSYANKNRKVAQRLHGYRLETYLCHCGSWHLATKRERGRAVKVEVEVQYAVARKNPRVDHWQFNHLHNDEASAEAEAIRLAEHNPFAEFYVVEIKSLVRTEMEI